MGVDSEYVNLNMLEPTILPKMVIFILSAEKAHFDDIAKFIKSEPYIVERKGRYLPHHFHTWGIRLNHQKIARTNASI